MAKKLKVQDPENEPQEEQQEFIPEVTKSKAETFEYDGETYEILVKQIRIPGIGTRTAIEILVDEEAQAWLVTKNSGAIKKIV